MYLKDGSNGGGGFRPTTTHGCSGGDGGGDGGDGGGAGGEETVRRAGPGCFSHQARCLKRSGVSKERQSRYGLCVPQCDQHIVGGEGRIQDSRVLQRELLGLPASTLEVHRTLHVFLMEQPSLFLMDTPLLQKWRTQKSVTASYILRSRTDVLRCLVLPVP